MIHIYKKGTNNKVLFLLHGTGGDENDLIGLGTLLDKEATIISLRGNVSENGMNRFFKRLSVGVYDIPNLEFETLNLKNFIEESIIKYNLQDKDLIGLGFSNGANILESLQQLYPDTLNKLILLSPVYLRPNLAFKNALNTDIYISAAINDPFETYENIVELKTSLITSNNNVYVYKHNEGHRISIDVLNNLKEWYLRK